MWRLKQLIPKEQAGLEGRTVEVGSLRLQIRNTIAEGGFSCVYLARDAQSGKQFALKHIVCNDTESLDLVKTEVNALKALRGHPNVITLHGQAMYDMGRTKECFIATEYCEKMMVEYLENRGAGFFEEKQLLLMFRDISNAVYAMHCFSPPMAHRDLKAENLLLGSDGQWKLCDFGSISTNHKRFEKAAEMGIEEDIIRKHTTPAYRAPEMWDLYTRELISEKVDIWALGCLLFRMAYLKSAFDGDSKLQILNGNYRIPDQPKYSANITGLIKEMLNSSPEARPTAMQVWQRANSALPLDYQKDSPDKAPLSASSQDSTAHGPRAPTRAPPPPPQRTTDQGSSFVTHKETERTSSPLAEKKGSPLGLKEKDLSPVSNASKEGGSFWSTQYAQEAVKDDSKSSASQVSATGSSRQHGSASSIFGTQKPNNVSSNEPRSVRSKLSKNREVAERNYIKPGEDEVTSDDDGNSSKRGSTVGMSQPAMGAANVNKTSEEAFTEFVADFQKASIFTAESVATRENGQLELERLRNELKQAEREKSEFVSKYEKLAAICRSQRAEIQELKAALVTANTHPSTPKGFSAESSQAKPDLQGGTIWNLQQGMTSQGNYFEPQGWKAFDEASPKQTLSAKREYHQDAKFGSTRFETSRQESSKTGSSHENSQKARSGGEVWGLHDSFATLGTGFAAAKGTGEGFQNEGAIGSSSAYNGGLLSRGSLHTTATHSIQPAGWSNF